MATLKVKVMPKDCPISQIVMNYTVMTIATEVPGMTDRGTSNGERGTVLGIYFYTAGTKMFLRSCVPERHSRNVERRGVTVPLAHDPSLVVTWC